MEPVTIKDENLWIEIETVSLFGNDGNALLRVSDITAIKASATEENWTYICMSNGSRYIVAVDYYKVCGMIVYQAAEAPSKYCRILKIRPDEPTDEEVKNTIKEAVHNGVSKMTSTNKKGGDESEKEEV